MSPVVFDDPMFDHRDYQWWFGYGRSRTASILHGIGITAAKEPPAAPDEARVRHRPGEHLRVPAATRRSARCLRPRRANRVTVRSPSAQVPPGSEVESRLILLGVRKVPTG